VSKTIQVRDVPDDVHHRLKVRAAERRMSLSELVREELIELAGKPTMAELLEKLSQDEPLRLSESVAEVLRAERAEAGRE
jgi:plasmid stability protein